MANVVYIVMCDNPLTFLPNGTPIGSEERYHIDSVWISEKKANSQCEKLNSEEEAEWREEYGYGLFTVNKQYISK